MKRKNALAVAAVLAVVAIFAANASAYYHPTLGRWASRDPGPGGSPARAGTAGPAASGGFMPRDQYADGMNLYQYVRSNPLVYVDWRGRQATRPAPVSLSEMHKLMQELRDAKKTTFDSDLSEAERIENRKKNYLPKEQEVLKLVKGGFAGKTYIAVICNRAGSLGGHENVPGFHCELLACCNGACARAGSHGAFSSSGSGARNNNLIHTDPVTVLDPKKGGPVLRKVIGDTIGWTFYEVERVGGEESSTCQGKKCIERGAAAANFPDTDYQPLGPNSNTYAHKLLEKCCYKVKPWRGTQTRPHGAWGWDSDYEFWKPPEPWEWL